MELNSSATSIFLSQSYKDNWDSYNYALQHKNAPYWDYFIITASNEAQAEAYRLQINSRLKNGYLPKKTKYIVIADPQGKRVGSGGATLNVFKEIFTLENETGNNAENPFENLKILILHSGGDSKRVPQYSPLGKLFSKVPRVLPDGRYSTLFDEFVIAYSGIPHRMMSGVVVSSGDVLLLLNHLQIDLMKTGAYGISIKVAAEMGSHHGVFSFDSQDRVLSFLHKMKVQDLKLHNAVNKDGDVYVDTGLIFLDNSIAFDLTKLLLENNSVSNILLDKFINDKVRLSFYGDFLIPMTKNAEQASYLKEPPEGEMCDELVECRKIIFNTLKNHKMFIQKMHPAEFIHFGTTKELSTLMSCVSEKFSHLDWQRNIVSYNLNSNITAINSFIENNAKIGENCYIEDSQINENAIIGKNSIISNTNIFTEKCTILNDTVLNVLPINYKNENGFVARIYGVYDNPKNELKNNCTFLNKPLIEFLSKNEISEKDIWEGNEKSLWEANLFPVAKSENEAIEFALLIQDMAEGKKVDVNKYLSAERLSLKSSFEFANVVKIYEKQNNLENKIRANIFTDKITKDKISPICAIKEIGNDISKIEKCIDVVLTDIANKKTDFSDKIRIFAGASKVLETYEINKSTISYDYDSLLDLSFSVVTEAIGQNDFSIENISYNIKENKVFVSLPVRINFGGGWSDTPPYCLENGGTVLNCAISLNGELPINVTVEKTDDYNICFESIDLATKKAFDDIDELKEFANPKDPFALFKAALFACGILPLSEKITLKEILSKMGCGFKITTRVNVPKGSGMGTSSILAAAMAMALNKFFGAKINNQEIFNQVLIMEQLMTTGGGWQDQVGGVVPGIKLVSSKAGLKQNINIEKVNIEQNVLDELNSRLVLIFTGQTRLAKNILRDIMGGYMLNDNEKIKIFEEIQRIAVLMKYELEKGNIDGFCELLNKHFNCSKNLSDITSNTFIDYIIEIIKPFVSGIMICGAGGGGFLQVVLKDKSLKENLKNELSKHFFETKVSLFDCEII